jgi:hypothetical protein
LNLRVFEDVEESVGPSHVDDETPCAKRKTKDGDRLCRPGERPSPFGPKDPQNCRNQRPGMANSDKKDKVCDVKTPEDGPV